MKEHIIEDIGRQALPMFVMTRILENHRKVSGGQCMMADTTGPQYAPCANPDVECVDCLGALKISLGTALLNGAAKEPKE